MSPFLRTVFWNNGGRQRQWFELVLCFLQLSVVFTGDGLVRVRTGRTNGGGWCCTLGGGHRADGSPAPAVHGIRVWCTCAPGGRHVTCGQADLGVTSFGSLERSALQASD
eukprot:2677333-Rhodomonas_salina.2